ncbi:MAG: hypothetical protein MJZ26_06250 [Fibrobacter sp.]|nr:hypothetical protein [Fibrobacter sp.]
MKFTRSLVLSVGLAAFGLVACDDSSSASSEDSPKSSSSKEISSSSEEGSSNLPALDCSVSNGVKVVAPKEGESFKMGETITVIYGSDVQGSGYRFVFKTSEDDEGVDMLEESAGPEEPDGKTCYEQKVKLTEDVAEPTETAIIRVIPYEQTRKAGNSATFKVTK